MDLVLSSGFLAFAGHCGFLRAVEESGVEVDGICGTSSGALVGALWAAGIPATEIGERLSSRRPFTLLQPTLSPWRGLFSLRRLVALLEDWLPPTFADLDHPLAVGVMSGQGVGALISVGRLPEAVAASCAVPYLFAPVEVDGALYRDGGAVDRLGLEPWLQMRGGAQQFIHLVERSAGADTAVPLMLPAVKTPRSGASFWSLGDFPAQSERARLLTREALAALLPQPSVGGMSVPPLPPTASS